MLLVYTENILIQYFYTMVEKLNRIKVAETLKSLGVTVFSPAEFRGFFHLPPKNASMFISRNIRSGLFVKLRSNAYMLKDGHPPAYVVANRLYQPSYVSLETALAHYGLIPETVYTVTSVTPKSTREFTTPLGAFTYQRIKRRAFTGYRAQRIEGQVVLLAEPEKALVDYLYFVDLRKVSLNDRLRLRKIDRSRVAKHAALFGRPSLMQLIRRVYALQRQPRTIH